MWNPKYCKRFLRKLNCFHRIDEFYDYFWLESWNFQKWMIMIRCICGQNFSSLGQEKVWKISKTIYHRLLWDTLYMMTWTTCICIFFLSFLHSFSSARSWYFPIVLFLLFLFRCLDVGVDFSLSFTWSLLGHFLTFFFPRIYLWCSS